MNIGFCGRYKLTVRKADSGLIVREYEFPNVITNIGMLKMRDAAVANSSLNLSYCYVGTGQNTPTVSDATMGAFSRYFNTQSVAITAPVEPDYVSKKHMTYRMQAGNAGNYTEVGVGWSSNPNGNLFSRALILDEYGNPSVITVLSDEYLDVVYTVEGYPSLNDKTGSFELNGVTHTVLSRLAYATQSCFSAGNGAFKMSAPFVAGILYVFESQQLGTIEGYPTGTASSASGYIITSRSALGDENSYGVRSVITFPLGTANTPGGVIGAMYVNPAGLAYDTDVRTQMSFTPPIPKTNNNTLTLTFEQWFGRHV